MDRAQIEIIKSIGGRKELQGVIISKNWSAKSFLDCALVDDLKNFETNMEKAKACIDDAESLFKEFRR